MNQPQPAQQTSDAIVNGVTYKLVAFYYPDSLTAWDKFYGCECLGNFYPCNAKITMTRYGIAASFHNSEAAFQATKWWKNDTYRQLFEQAMTGNDAYQTKKEAEQLQPPDYTYAGFGNPPDTQLEASKKAMSAILEIKFSDPAFQKILLATGNAYLLEHKFNHGRPETIWSDNFDGSGDNNLGKTLMEIREFYGGKGSPIAEGTYHVRDFTVQVKPHQ